MSAARMVFAIRFLATSAFTKRRGERDVLLADLLAISTSTSPLLARRKQIEFVRRAKYLL